jgi:hypothetical protein
MSWNLTEKGKFYDRYLNELIRFKPTGHETDILYDLFKKYDIQDVLPIIQNYVNKYNKELCCVLNKEVIYMCRSIDINHHVIRNEIRNIILQFSIFKGIHDEKRTIKKDLQLLKSNGMYRNQLEDLEKQKNELIDKLYISLTPSIVLEFIEVLRILYPAKIYPEIHCLLNSLLDY